MDGRDVSIDVDDAARLGRRAWRRPGRVGSRTDERPEEDLGILAASPLAARFRVAAGSSRGQVTSPQAGEAARAEVKDVVPVALMAARAPAMRFGIHWFDDASRGGKTSKGNDPGAPPSKTELT